HRRRNVHPFAANPRRRRRHGHRRRHANPFALNPRRRKRHHRRFRRNPFGVSTRGITGTILSGAKAGAGVILGEAIIGNTMAAIAARVPTGPVGFAVAGAVATVTGMLTQRFLGSQWGGYASAGAWAWIYRGILANVRVPFFSAGVSGYVPLAGYTPLSGVGNGRPPV